MSVCSAAPLLPLNCKSFSWGCHLEWIIHKVGASGSQAVWSMDLFKMNRAGRSYVAEGAWKRQGHLYFSSFFIGKKAPRRGVKRRVRYVFRKVQFADYFWKCMHSFPSSVLVFDLWLHTSCGCQSGLISHSINKLICNECSHFFRLILFFMVSVVMPLLCAWMIQARVS